MNSQVLIDELERITHDKRTPNDISQELAALLIAMRALATPAHIPDAGEGVEVVGYLTPYALEVDRQMDDDKPLMTVAQHTRIVSALQASAMVMPKGAVLVGRSELSLVRNALELDCEQGRPVRGEMLIELDKSIQRFDDMLAASPAPGDSQ